MSFVLRILIKLTILAGTHKSIFPGSCTYLGRHCPLKYLEIEKRDLKIFVSCGFFVGFLIL